jgi:hypothetical protein
MFLEVGDWFRSPVLGQFEVLPTKACHRLVLAIGHHYVDNHCPRIGFVNGNRALVDRDLRWGLERKKREHGQQ